MEDLFIQCCIGNKLEKAKDLYMTSIQNGSLINIKVRENYAFKVSLSLGNLDICKWLYNIDKTVAYDRTKSFMNACKNGHLEISQWLYSLGDIDITINDDYAFQWSCACDCIEVALWLQSLDPERYSLTIENDNIIFWEIKTNSVPVDSEITYVDFNEIFL